MLKTLSLANFTVFKNIDLHFGTGLNLFVGENGLGKTHLLKVPYAVLKPGYDESRRVSPTIPTKTFLQSAIASKMVGVFRPDSLGRLAKRRQGKERAEVHVGCVDSACDISITFATNSKSEVEIESVPEQWFDQPLVYIPTRELLTIFPGFVSLYENYHLEFEETWRDTCVFLGGPISRGPREKDIAQMLEPIESALGGKVVLDPAGRFYLAIPGSGKMEMPLVAEGERKLAMLARLVATGALSAGGVLFWDEPEANLNPKLARILAKTVVELTFQGIQVFLATHSLFLMRELEIILRNSRYAGLNNRFFGLRRNGTDVEIDSGDSFDDLVTVTSLEEELAQSDRFLDEHE